MTTGPARHAGAVLTVDLDAVVENWRKLDRLTGPAECAAVVKADAYGIGASQAGSCLRDAGCRSFFVATPDEGITLRSALGAGPKIYVFHGLMGAGTLFEFDEYGLVPVLNTPGDIDGWSTHARNSGGRPAVLAIDTGMQRLGLSPAQMRDIASTPGKLDGLSLDFVMSHLACADDAGHSMNAEQRNSFDELRTLLPSVRASLANSGGIFLGPDYHYDLARPGAALYGISRSTGAPEPMRQVVGLKAKILQIRVVDSESTVGYGATHTVAANSRLATVAAGYADGYLRSLSNSGHGFAAGIKLPVAGRISMDLTVFDISAVPPDTLSPGDEIDLICAEQTVDDVADDAGTIGYEILTALGARYERRYLESTA